MAFGHRKSKVRRTAMRNKKFVTIVIWAVVLLVVVGLALPAITSFFGF
jgi:hypothetical protein